MSQLIKIYPENPNQKEIEKAVSALRSGELIIIPTDTVYSFAADITKPKALEKLARLKGKKIQHADFSFLFYDLSHLSDYTKQFDTPTYKLLKKALPGPYTFILEANNTVPKIFKSKKRTIGIRVPDNNIARAIVKELGNPVATSSIHDEDAIIEYTTDPELIFEKHHHLVALVVDGGYGDNDASTVIDLSDGAPEVIREGKGSLDLIL
ncbi:MAG: threonylcarbamoyl-AMP synthase [Schleiferiaceae bacterium]|nr:threonylcarbamoyl-AMP synthase [Schleiferiaceae bacterium]